MPADQSSHKSFKPLLKVRTGKGYAVKFVIPLGQRNAEITPKLLPPLHRLFPWADAFAITPEPGYDLIHTLNAIPILNRCPYLVTFEDYMPRVPDDRYIGWLEKWLQQRLSNPQCVALIAMSQYARRQFLKQNRTFYGLPLLEQKLHVIYPAKPLYRQDPKRMSGELRLIFAGGDFMRKGLPALLKAHHRLKQSGIPVQTTVLSNLNWNMHDYLGPSSKEYVDQQRALLSQDGIEVRPFVPYEKLLSLLEQADYMVFPTLHDTFGLVTLDALSCGTPVIVTGTCAQPEMIEDGRCGYLLPFENDPDPGKWVWLYRNREPGYLEAYDRAINALSDAIFRRLVQCWEERKNYEMLSAGALNQFKMKFHSDLARDKIEELYELCRGAKNGRANN